MMRENEIIPFRADLETVAEMTWQQFTDRATLLWDKLAGAYDESPVERREYSKDVCVGGENFGKTVNWVVNYSPHPLALESIAFALEAIVQWPNAGSMAWEMRRFIKGSNTYGYNNIPDVVRFGEVIKKIGDDDPTNEKGFQLDMDFFYWDSGCGVDGESTDEERFRAHSANVTGVLDGLKRYAYPEIIDVKRNPTQEEIEAQEREEKEQYWKDFLADAKSLHQRPSFFDLLDREQLINRPDHKILTYPVGIAEVADGHWINRKYDDPSDAVTHFYREVSVMVHKRSDKNWFPQPPIPADYTGFYDAKFKIRLERTLGQKPWLINFSVRWQDMLQRSFIGGNHGRNHAGEVELVYKNPRYDPSGWSFLNDEYSYRLLEPEEEKLFFESVTDVRSLADMQPPVKPPRHTYVFNGQTGTPYLFELADGRKFNIFLKHEYGSIFWEGKIVIIAPEGKLELT